MYAFLNCTLAILFDGPLEISDNRFLFDGPLEISDNRFKIDLNPLATAVCCFPAYVNQIVNYCVGRIQHASFAYKIVHKLIRDIRGTRR